MDIKRLQAAEMHEHEPSESAPLPVITHEVKTWGEYLWCKDIALAHGTTTHDFAWKSSNVRYETIEQIDAAITLLQEAKRLLQERKP